MAIMISRGPPDMSMPDVNQQEQNTEALLPDIVAAATSNPNLQ
jgi:hypothetical protein